MELVSQVKQAMTKDNAKDIDYRQYWYIDEAPSALQYTAMFVKESQQYQNDYNEILQQPFDVAGDDLPALYLPLH